MTGPVFPLSLVQFVRTFTGQAKEDLDGSKNSKPLFLFNRFGLRRSGSSGATLSRRVLRRLEGMEENLESACRDVEPDFIGMGQVLQEIYARTGEITEAANEGIQLLNGDNQKSILARSGAIAGTSLEHLEQSQEDLRKSLSEVKNIADLVDNLRKGCPLVERISMLIRVVALNIGVESTRTPEATERFSIVARELGRLSEKTGGIAGEADEYMTRALSRQLSVHKTLSDGLEKLKTVAQKTVPVVEEAMAGIEAFTRFSQDALGASAVQSREISREVGELVMNIQFHDSLSQRIQHITLALRDIQGFNQEGAEAHAVLAVQTEQLREIVKEIRDVHDKSGAAFDHIYGQIEGLEENLSRLESGEHDSVNEGERRADPFTTLQGSFERLGSLILQGEKMIGKVQGTADEASGAATQVADCVQEIRGVAYESHIMALNAIIKAAHLGEGGKTLEVLAQEIKRAADRSMEFASSVDTVLGEIHVAVDRIRDTAERMTEKTDRPDGETTLMTHSAEQVVVLRDRYGEHAGHVGLKAGNLKKKVAETRDKLFFLEGLERELEAQLSLIETAKKDLEPLVEKGDGPVPMKDRLSDSYTMRSEREVHNRVFNTGGQIQETSEDPFEEEEDGICLFQDTADETPEAFLFTQNEQPPGEVSDREEDLGDNVELF
jgi:methyl-accepting chemotaxis protein